MSLPPHLHLLIPCSSPQTHLEARLYFPLPLDDTVHDGDLPISQKSGSKPIKLHSLSPALRTRIQEMGIERLVTASHPWAKLGGNMLDPVLSHHLLNAAVDQSGADATPKTAVLTFNVRGCGHSEGSAPLVTVGREPEDFAAIEKAGLALCSAKEVSVEAWRFVSPARSSHSLLHVEHGNAGLTMQGYSWGCVSALAAPLPPQGVARVFIVSPALVGNKALGLITKTATAAIKDYLSPKASQADGTSEARSRQVQMIYGTADNFTGVATYRAVATEYQDKGLKGVEVEGADHFWRSDSAEEALEKAIKEWLAT